MLGKLEFNHPGSVGVVDKDIAIGARGLGSILEPVESTSFASSLPLRRWIPPLVTRFGVIPGV